jgi:hypothetical protein
VVLALSIPFAWLGVVTDIQLYRGIPVAALAFVCPVSAAALLFAVALYHALANLSVKSMFPGGSYEAERLITLILAAAAATVTIIWEPRTLTRVSS